MRLTFAAPWVALAALGSAVLFVPTAALAREDPPASAPRPEVDTAAALSALRSALPQGWKITRTQEGRVPDGWVTRDAGGLLVEGGSGAKRFRTWFLPRDWIGICPRPPDDVWRRHGSGVLIGDGWKAITLCDDREFVQALWGKVGQTASLVASGEFLATTIYSARIAEVDAHARKLLEEECITATDIDGAVVSLLVLGIPAPSVFRDAAARGSGDTAGHCAWALGQFPGKATVETLSGVVGDPASEDKCVKMAAMALERLADPAAGPALMKALPRVRWSEAAIAVAGALGRIRWKDAGPALLRRMRTEENAWYKAEYAKPLASVRYDAAIEDLRAMAGEMEFSAEWILGRRKQEVLGNVPGVALLRMTGAWGSPADGARCALLPPKSAQIGKAIVVALVIENVGDADLEEIPILEGTVYIDDVAVPREPRSYDGCFTLPPNDVGVFEHDLTQAIKGPGRYRVRYVADKVTSNEIEIEIEVHEAAK